MSKEMLIDEIFIPSPEYLRQRVTARLLKKVVEEMHFEASKGFLVCRVTTKDLESWIAYPQNFRPAYINDIANILREKGYKVVFTHETSSSKDYISGYTMSISW